MFVTYKLGTTSTKISPPGCDISASAR